MLKQNVAVLTVGELTNDIFFHIILLTFGMGLKFVRIKVGGEKYDFTEGESLSSPSGGLEATDSRQLLGPLRPPMTVHTLPPAWSLPLCPLHHAWSSMWALPKPSRCQRHASGLQNYGPR